MLPENVLRMPGGQSALGPPLSEKKSTTASSQSAEFFMAEVTFPMAESMAVTMARYVRRSESSTSGYSSRYSSGASKGPCTLWRNLVRRGAGARIPGKVGRGTGVGLGRGPL